MSHTITQLLKKIGLDHYVPPESPLLKFPLSCFRDNEHPEVITFLLLYQHHWLAEINTPPQKELGQISESYATTYYTRLLSEVRRGFAEMNISASEPAKRTLPIDPSIWLSSKHMVLMLQKKPLFEQFRMVLNYLEPLNVLFKWLKSETLEAAEEQQLNRFFVKPDNNEIDAVKIKAFATLIVNYEFLSHGHEVRRMVDKQILKINSSKVMEVESYEFTSPKVDVQHIVRQQIMKINESKNINNEFGIPTQEILHSLFIELSRRFPINLQHLLAQLTIDIPTNTSDWCRSILQINLRHIPELNESQWPELIYYFALFMYQLADTDFRLAAYAYPETQLTSWLAQLMQTHAPYLNTHTQIHNKQITQWNHTLKAELKEQGIALHPQLLGLLCFKNCPALKALFIKTWFQLDIISQYPTETVVLSPSTNQFLFGHIYSNSKTGKSIALNDNEMPVFLKLIDVVDEYNAHQAQHEFQSLRLQTQTPVPFRLSPPIESVASSSSPATFFTPKPQKSSISPRLNFINSELLFNQIKRGMTDNYLTRRLSFNDLINYELKPVLNYSALVAFLFQFANTEGHLIPDHALNDFLELCPNEQKTDELTESSSFMYALLNFSEAKGIKEQIECYEAIVQHLSCSPETERSELNIKWLAMQKYMFNQIVVKLKQTNDKPECPESPFILL